MRIVMAHSHLNTLGGGERVTLELSRRLGQRHDLTLWAGDFRASETYAGLAELPRRDLAPLEWLWAVPHADAVVSHTFGANLLALRHPRTLCYLHTLRSVYARRADRPDLVARRVLERAALGRAGALATNSHYTAQRIMKRYGREPEVVPCGVDPALFEIAAPPGGYALYVGRLAPEKGMERLLAWMAELPIELVMVGTGRADYEAHLRRMAGPRVRWLGPLAGEALRRVYEASGMLVFVPHEEEFGLVVLEAMAAGRPVVAAPEGGIPELVKDGETGYLVRDRLALAAAVMALAGDAALGTRMGSAGREAARGYSWDVMANRVEALCAGMVERAQAERERPGRGAPERGPDG